MIQGSVIITLGPKMHSSTNSLHGDVSQWQCEEGGRSPQREGAERRFRPHPPSQRSKTALREGSGSPEWAIEGRPGGPSLLAGGRMLPEGTILKISGGSDKVGPSYGLLKSPHMLGEEGY